MGAAGFSGVLIGTKSLFCFAPLYEILKIMPHTAHRRSLLREAAAAQDASCAVHVESSDNMRSRKVQSQAPPDNPETGDTCHSRQRSCAGEKIEHQNTSGTAAVRVRMHTSEADFHKPRIYGGSVRAWANAWDVSRRTLSRGPTPQRVGWTVTGPSLAGKLHSLGFC